MVIGEHRVGLDDLRAVRAALIAEEACVLLDEAAAIAAVAQLDPGPGGGEGGAAVPGLDDLGDGARAPGAEIGRASCRERVGLWVGDGAGREKGQSRTEGEGAWR